MLNFSAGPLNIGAACHAAEIKTILTSTAFVERGKLGGLIEPLSRRAKIVYLDELRTTISGFDKLRGFLAGATQERERGVHRTPNPNNLPAPSTTSSIPARRRQCQAIA
jgi:hypothetical protein